MYLERLNALRGREGFFARHRDRKAFADVLRDVLPDPTTRRPALKEFRMRVARRISPNDLHPIATANYYHHAMRGSFSIKKVLPTIAPDLDFDALEEVSDGTAAQVAYLYAAFDPQTTPERKAEFRDRPLIYCKQDTWAMVEVAYFLHRQPRPVRAS
jgi:hypothetical protein